jgi:hypothetical protein
MRFLFAAMIFMLALAPDRFVRADIWVGGHGDIGAEMNASNQLELHFHFGSDVNAAGGGTIAAGGYAPSAIQVSVPGPSIDRPSGSQWNFLGATSDQVWFLPPSIDPNKPYLGWGLEELDPADWNGDLTWSLTSVVSAPAGSNISLWKEEFGAPTPFFATSDGISAADAFTQPAGSHEHFFLGFTRLGMYQIELSIAGNHKTFGALSDSAVFTFAVVPEPTSTALIGIASLGLATRFVRRRKSKCSDEKTIEA